MSKSLKNELLKLIDSDISALDAVKERFSKRLKEGKLTRDENPQTHFACFFIAYDPKVKQVYLGHHKKSDLWICNGGHIDKGEMLEETVRREIVEEWGVNFNKIPYPQLLTITDIENDIQICRRHYDIWYFLPVNKNNFKPDTVLEEKEFYEMKWFNVVAARKMNVSQATLEALDYIEKDLF